MTVVNTVTMHWSAVDNQTARNAADKCAATCRRRGLRTATYFVRYRDDLRCLVYRAKIPAIAERASARKSPLWI
jgi:hypothetical protein